ncbi:hypothetical protein CBR_g1129 [Chara braunii]|uniref:DUF659 domain-containing protein n=1 Tax=Chara braunii TaxID=69332 RepID=A0A388KD87_CHABU|nr:hypothetical protein CBR_g1129 [Chara braunii]|eukprot:GBG68009.1 hypothetical protein CBR_g1129 [Chara braunii]
MSHPNGKAAADSSNTAKQGHNTKTFNSPFKVDPAIDGKRDDPVWHFIAGGRYLYGSTAAGRKSGHRCLCRLCGCSICGGAKAAKEHFSKSEKFRCEAATAAVWHTIWSKDMAKCPKDFISAIEALQILPNGHPKFQWPPLRFPEDSAVPVPGAGAAEVPIPVSDSSPTLLPATTGAAAADPPILTGSLDPLYRTRGIAVAQSAAPASPGGLLDVGILGGRATRGRDQGTYRQQVVTSYYSDPLEHVWHLQIMRFIVKSGMTFNCVKLESFKRMFTMVIPPGVPGAPMPKLPTYHPVRTTLLDELDAEVQKCVRPLIDTAREHGCTIMTDIRGQTMCNYLVGTELGAAYVATDVMHGKKGATALATSWLKRVKSMDVDLSDITAFVTDSTGVNVATTEVFQKDESVKHIFWIPCVAHVMDLNLEDNGGIDWVAARIAQARLVTRFFKRHGHAREVLEVFSKKTLLLPAKTRFGTNVIMMQRLVDLRGDLTQLVGDDRWRETVWSTNKIRKDAAEVTACIGFRPWWEDFIALFKMLEPIMDMLRLVDNDTRHISKILRRYEVMIASCLSACRGIDREEQDAILEVFDRRRIMFRTPAHTTAMLLDPDVGANTLARVSALGFC